MIDDAVGARQPKQMGDGEGVDHARRLMHLAVGALVSRLRRKGPRVLVQREKAAGRIERRVLEELEKRAGVVDQPQPVGRQRREARRSGRRKFLCSAFRHTMQTRVMRIGKGRAIDHAGSIISRSRDPDQPWAWPDWAYDGRPYDLGLPQAR